MIERANADGGLRIPLLDMSEVNANAPDQPVSAITWVQATQFVNWLNTSQGFHPAYTEGLGAWDPAQSFVDARGLNRFRHKDTRYVLPSVDEWYKAAYYDPSANNGVGGYWDYPNGRDEPPAPVAQGTDSNTAVYGQDPVNGPAPITQAGGLSPYGVMGMGGNALELTETSPRLINDRPNNTRISRGGAWFSRDLQIGVSGWGATPAEGNFIGYGFRVASVPEPTCTLHIGFAIATWLMRRRIPRAAVTRK